MVIDHGIFMSVFYLKTWGRDLVLVPAPKTDLRGIAGPVPPKDGTVPAQAALSGLGWSW